MKLSLCFLRAFAFVLCGAFAATNVFAQADSLVGQITSSTGNTVVRDISGNGRFVVFESDGDLATQNRTARNNADGNIEVFLFDYAQRRIFQITNTTRALKTVTGSSTANNNIQVDVANTRPSISNDGRWIAFTSNAAATFTVNSETITQTPLFFEGNRCTAPTVADCNVTASDGTNANRPTLTRLQADGNNEIWLYRIPDAVVNATVDLSSGAEIPILDANAGTLARVTDSPQSRPPLPGTDSQQALIRDDNFFPTINDDGSLVAFVSDRNLSGENGGLTAARKSRVERATPAVPSEANREIFVFRRTDASGGGTNTQITVTNRGTFTQPIFNTNPTIARNPAGNFRVAFISTATNPLVPGSSAGSNADFNAEVFYVNLNADGTRTSTFVQVTNTTDATPEQVSNLFSTGRRISRDGRFIAYESLATTPAGSGTADANGYGLFLFDTTLNTTRLIGGRTFSDSGAVGGDVRRFPVFTDYNASGEAQTVVFASRLNYLANGTIASASGEGLNQDAVRPVQIYSTPLDAASATPTVNLTRISRIPAGGIAETQPAAANSARRIAFSLLGTEVGGGNSDFGSEAYYLLTPIATSTATTGLTISTGASNRPVVVATPTPSVSPSPSPSPSVSPSVSPSPVTSPAPGLSRGSLAVVNLAADSTGNSAVAASDYASRRFQLPIELAGVTVSVGNVAAGIYSVDRATRQVRFVVPIGLAIGSSYRFVVNDNGRAISGTIAIIATQPDVFTKGNLPQPLLGNPARAAVLNVTNRVQQGEPFPVFSFPLRRSVRSPTVLRVFATGVEGVPSSVITIQVGSQSASGSRILTGAVAAAQPGVYTIDFTLPPEAIGLGDVPITITISNGASSSLADIAPRLTIL